MYIQPHACHKCVIRMPGATYESARALIHQIVKFNGNVTIWDDCGKKFVVGFLYDKQYNIILRYDSFEKYDKAAMYLESNINIGLIERLRAGDSNV